MGERGATPPRRRAAARGALLAGAAAGGAWLSLCLVGLWVLPRPDLGGLGIVLAVLLPLALIALATRLAMGLAALRHEADALRRELSRLRRHPGEAPAMTKPGTPKPAEAPLPPQASPPLPDLLAGGPQPPPEAPRREPGQNRRIGDRPRGDMAAAPGPAPAARTSDQGVLPLTHDATRNAKPLPLDELIRAIHFPESPEDAAGFRALRHALQDHTTAQMIQASQDVLTLLSQSGVYMDDLEPEPPQPEIWRRFAQGERGRPMAPIGGIHDDAALQMAAARMRDDPVFRDATHHFLRRFDGLLARIEPEAATPQIEALAQTRTARAFMLLGRATGMFDQG